VRSFTTKRGQLAKVRLFWVDLVSRFGVMLQEKNGKVGSFISRGQKMASLQFFNFGDLKIMLK
jgi:hypothetical protein